MLKANYGQFCIFCYGSRLQIKIIRNFLCTVADSFNPINGTISASIVPIYFILFGLSERCALLTAEVLITHSISRALLVSQILV
jgi:hypothetical protein